MFEDPACAFVDASRITDGEPRAKVIGLVKGRLLTVVYTQRAGAIRLISVRRANPPEARRYAIVRYSPPEEGVASEDEFARLDAMTDEEITRAAEDDPDNPPFTDYELDLVTTSRVSKLARHAAGLSQEAFAAAYHLSLGRVRDLEQGRTTADMPLLYFLRQIAKDPAAVRAELESRAA